MTGPLGCLPGEDGSVESLTELRERRAFQCRLTPDRALRSLEEADAFLRDRGLLTRTADCALPSLYEACHEDPYKIGSPGFATWPATKWPWFGELAGRASWDRLLRCATSVPEAVGHHGQSRTLTQPLSCQSAATEASRSVWRLPLLGGSITWHVRRTTRPSCVPGRCGWSRS
jgi:hypothetical protein